MLLGFLSSHYLQPSTHTLIRPEKRSCNFWWVQVGSRATPKCPSVEGSEGYQRVQGIFHGSKWPLCYTSVARVTPRDLEVTIRVWALTKWFEGYRKSPQGTFSSLILSLLKTWILTFFLLENISELCKNLKLARADIIFKIFPIPYQSPWLLNISCYNLLNLIFHALLYLLLNLRIHWLNTNIMIYI